MPLYLIARWLARVALEWFYRDIEVVGIDRVPRDGPLLLAVNHPNQLIDALIVMRYVPRRAALTAKATLFENPVIRLLFAWYGIIPLRRTRDEAQRDPSRQPAADRNVEAFRAILDALERRKAVLIFPEGTSHNEPHLAPLRTGLARIALQARDERGVRGLRIAPIGLVFERKWAPRTRILVHAGDPIDMDTWRPPAREGEREAPAVVASGAGVEAGGPAPAAVAALTREIDERLRATTLNFPTADDAERVLGTARILAGVFDAPRPLSAPDTPLMDEAQIARRVAVVRSALAVEGQPPAFAERVEGFEARLEALRSDLEGRGIPPNDVAISPQLAPGAWFAIREAAVIAAAGPIAWWGRLNHWLPLRLAVWLARRTSRTPEDPAMHTIVIGLILVLLAYAAQMALVWALTSPMWALLYVASLPLAASWDFRFRERVRRAAGRMRAYFQLRGDPGLRRRLADEIAWLREEALALERRAQSVGVGSIAGRGDPSPE
ncbi:MAG: lysophospholipid acyltransferase family protein [Gemmatimonadota bacterium]|nr:lysophospholipid acyltransferase family protein [Gemmatimonadota bacterium]